MASLSSILVYPVKALDPVLLDRVAFTSAGGLEGDRVCAIVDEEGDYVNGKRTADVHRLRTEVDLDRRRIALAVQGEDNWRTFDLDADRDALEAWLADYFGFRVQLREGAGGSQTDSVVYGDDAQPGATVISESTLREVASWFDGIDSRELRRRLRPNLVVEGVPTFWEDRLVAAVGQRFRIGDVTLAGVEPIPRCVVPTRDPTTGTVYDGFRETFLDRREATWPEWVDQDAGDANLYRLMVLVRALDADRDDELAVGDRVRLGDAELEP